MTIQELLRFRKNEIEPRCIDLLQSKGSDYSGEQDTLRNLRLGNEYGIVMRLGDKLYRLENLLKKEQLGQEASVQDESLVDSVLDARNYLDLLLALRFEQDQSISTRVRDREDDDPSNRARRVDRTGETGQENDVQSSEQAVRSSPRPDGQENRKRSEGSSIVVTGTQSRRTAGR